MKLHAIHWIPPVLPDSRLILFLIQLSRKTELRSDLSLTLGSHLGRQCQPSLHIFVSR